MKTIQLAIRNLKSQGKYALINISGLILGIILTINMVLLFSYEITYDGFHPDISNIYQVVTHDLKTGELEGNTPMPLSKTLKEDFPMVESVVGIWGTIGPDRELTYNNLKYSGFKGASVEEDIFDVFNFKLILGNKHNVFERKNNIVVSESLAKKIFGNTNPVGKVIGFDIFEFTVTGVFKDLPINSDFNFDILCSNKMRTTAWGNFNVAWWASGIKTYVKLKEGTTVEHFNSLLAEIPDKYFPDFLKGLSSFTSISFNRIHLNDNIKNNHATSPVYLSILGIIAILTLAIACINFVSLSSCQIFKGSKSIGVNKLLGASRKQIVISQVRLSFLSTIIALIIAIPSCYLLLPYFEYLVQRPISGMVNNLEIMASIVLIVFLVAFLIGFFPGVFYAKIPALKAINFIKNAKKSKSTIRSGFIVGQFSISTILIIALIVILKQLTFMQNADLGFDNENLLVVGASMIKEKNYKEKYRKAELYIENAERFASKYGFSKGTITENIPGFYYQNEFSVIPSDSEINECQAISTAVGDNFTAVYGINIVEGRFFSKEIKSDREAIIINETLMQQLGWENIDSKYIKLKHEGGKKPVVGVIKDIHTTTLKETIPPMIYRYGQYNDSPSFITFRLSGNNHKEVIEYFKKQWRQLFPGIPFQPFFVKEKYLNNYTEEKRIAKIIGNFSLFAIIISSIGLLGVFIFLSEQKIKEIGIRKVNGAKVSEILSMLNKDFLKWIVISFLIACPIAYYSMTKWLENFTYKTELSWWIFIMSGGIALGIALLTVSWQSWRAATRNPVEALRYE